MRKRYWFFFLTGEIHIFRGSTDGGPGVTNERYNLPIEYIYIDLSINNILNEDIILPILRYVLFSSFTDFDLVSADQIIFLLPLPTNFRVLQCPVITGGDEWHFRLR